MILKGNQRGGGRQMALHLLNGLDNEHVTVHEVSGFIADDVLGALNEAHALSKATKCKQFMYSLSLNPPQDKKVPVADFEAALEKVEKKLALEGQPRVIVFHEKEGRRHAHCVWSRIDAGEMKAINMSFDRDKLNGISKSLFLEHGWTLPDGFRDKSRGNPLNYSREEWQQAARIGRKATDIKRELQESWAASDNRKSFENALGELGYVLARGDRRGYVAVDVYGEVYPLNKRKLGLEKKAIEARLGKADTLPSVEHAKEQLSAQLSGLFTRYEKELSALHDKQKQPLLADKVKMVTAQREARDELEAAQAERWQKEEQGRNARIRAGFKGLWDKLNGRYWKTRKRNEQETWKAHLRDQKERENLIQAQLAERQALQAQMNELRAQHDLERHELMRDMSHIKPHEKQGIHMDERDLNIDHGFDAPNLDDDLEPEI
jgi:hypothetical protein